MQRFYSIALISIVFAFLFGGCETPIDVTELESVVPVEKKFLAVQSTFSPNNIYSQNNSFFEVFVSSTQAITDSEAPMALPDADVQLFTNGDDWLETLTFNPTTQHYQGSIHKPIAGKTYKILVEHPDYESVSAMSTLPEAVKLKSTTIVEKQSKLSSFYPDFYELNLTIELAIDDPIEEDNYYHLVFRNKLVPYQVIANDTVAYTNIPPSKDIDYLFNFNENGINEGAAFLVKDNSSFAGAYLKDDTFNGQEDKILTFSLSILINPALQLADQMRVELHSVTKEYHDFQISAYNARQTGYNPFASNLPSVLSNINNGVGLFSSYNSDYKIVRLR